MKDRDLHRFIRERIVVALAGRPWAWLAREAGLPQSTLATQAAKPKFSIPVLWRVSTVLERSIAWFFPPSDQATKVDQRAASEALLNISEIINVWANHHRDLAYQSETSLRNHDGASGCPIDACPDIYQTRNVLLPGPRLLASADGASIRSREGENDEEEA